MAIRDDFEGARPSTEMMHRYAPGGLHPIHIGDLFNDGQYEILNKIGIGAYSTVWLAEDKK